MYNQKDIEKTNLQKTALLQKLKDQGIAEIIINFSGSGDSGDIDEVEYIDMNGNSPWQQGYQGPENSTENDNHIRDLFYEKVDDEACKHGDWVNNEGGYGSFKINTSTGAFELEYYQRTVESYMHQGDSIFDRYDNTIEDDIPLQYKVRMGQLPGTYQQ